MTRFRQLRGTGQPPAPKSRWTSFKAGGKKVAFIAGRSSKRFAKASYTYGKKAGVRTAKYAKKRGKAYIVKKQKQYIAQRNRPPQRRPKSWGDRYIDKLEAQRKVAKTQSTTRRKPTTRQRQVVVRHRRTPSRDRSGRFVKTR